MVNSPQSPKARETEAPRGAEFSPPGERPALFHLHIRKAGGTSVHEFLAQRFDVDQCLVKAHWLVHAGKDPNAFQFVNGHLGFDYAERFRRRPVVLTFLRDPIERSLSAFYFLRSFDPVKFAAASERTLGPILGPRRARAIELVQHLEPYDFIFREPELAAEMLGNEQTRALVDYDLQAPVEPLEQALRNLDRCDVVGLTERMDEALQDLAEQMGWPELGPVAHTNKTQRPPREALDRRTHDALADLTRVDAELYRYGVELVERRKRRRLSDEQPGNAIRAEHSAAPPDAADFRFSQPIHGEGWLPRESDGRQWFCWIGSARRAWVELSSPGLGPHQLTCDVAHALRSDVLEGVEVRVDGSRLEAKCNTASSGWQLAACVPSRRLPTSKRTVRIEFAVRDMVRPCDVNPESDDRRELGIAISRIQMRPVERN